MAWAGFATYPVGAPSRFVDTLRCVRYAFVFTWTKLLLLRRTDQPPHG